jgi:hypothetical protein
MSLHSEIVQVGSPTQMISDHRENRDFPFLQFSIERLEIGEAVIRAPHRGQIERLSLVSPSDGLPQFAYEGVESYRVFISWLWFSGPTD